MTNKRDESTNEDAIEGIAAGWIVEKEEGFAAGRAVAFARWRGLNPRHRVAAERLEGTHRLLLQLPRLREDERLVRRVERMIKPVPARVIRFPYFRLAAAAAVLALASILWWRQVPGNFQQQYATTEYGPTKVTLPDKSHLEIGGHSGVVVNYSARRRNIELIRGEANFSVARDTARPFEVAAGGIKVRAVGTVFRVRHGPGTVEVQVSEGRVQVSREGSPEVEALVAGQRLGIRTDTVGLARPGPSVDSPLPPAVPAAPSARLVFKDTPLSEVIEQFNLRNKVQLVIGDDEIADRLVGGEFAADKPEAFVRAFVNSEEISAEWTHPFTIVLRKGN